MAFVHSKSARLWVDQFELTSFFNDFSMNAKAGIAETTVYGLGAKSYIGGLKEGVIQGKGFFDPGATANDQILAAALGRNTNMTVTFVPNGSLVIGTRVIVAFAAETDLSVTAPVANVVGASFAAQADSGLSTGVLLFDPTAALTTTPTTFGTASTTVAAGSNAVNTNTFTGAGTLNVASTTGFQAVGSIIVATGTTPACITYTGVTGTTFTGCNTIFGGGALATGGTVNAGHTARSTSSTGGYVANLHVVTLTGTGTPTVTAKIQHSADGVTWADLTSFNGGNTISTIGAYSAFVAFGSTVNQYTRAVVVTAGTTVSTTVLIAAARQ